jgi:plastocyanin
MRSQLSVLLSLLLLPALAHAAGGEVSGEVTVIDGKKPRKDRSGVVVYLEGVPSPAGAPPGSAPSAMRQREQQFSPRVVAVQKGGKVEFPNDDKIFHNVFSLSQPAKFDLGLYKSGTSKSVTFDRPGTVDVYCNIHPEMVATIKVLDTPYFAVSDKDGRFKIAGVPAGTYPVVAWQPRGEPARGSVTVGSGGTATVRLTVTAGDEAPEHTRKDGSPYGRYQ